MSSIRLIGQLLAVASFAGALISCGGSGVGGGTLLSTAQANYEKFALAANGGAHDLLWSMPANGAPTNGTDFIVDISSGGLAQSPLTNGTQPNNRIWSSLSNTLSSLPTLPINLAPPVGNVVPTTGPTYRGPDRVVQNGAVVVVSLKPDLAQESYVGSNIEVDRFAPDGTTIVESTLISAVTTPISVANQPVAAPTDAIIAGWLNKYNLVANTTPLLNPGPAFAANSAYIELTATRKGDTLFVQDCAATQTTTSTTPVECQTNTTLGGAGVTTENVFGDGTGGVTKTWTLATDGTICEIANQGTVNCPKFGVRYWVASTPRTASMNVPEETTAYRVFFELNGNVYRGTLQKDGAQIGLNIGTDASPNIQPFFIRFNKQFVDSIKGALNF